MSATLQREHWNGQLTHLGDLFRVSKMRGDKTLTAIRKLCIWCRLTVRFCTYEGGASPLPLCCACTQLSGRSVANVGHR